jgi:hypothetical protein
MAGNAGGRQDTMPTRSLDASHLIDAACSFHGGLDAWLNVNAFQGSFRRLRGAIPMLKGLGVTFHMPSTFSVYPHQQRTVFHNFPSVDHETTFDGTTSPVRLLVTSPHEERELPNYRERFRGFAKWRRWSSADAAYFFGYALLTYFSVPFMLKDCAILRTTKTSVTVRFPSAFESHCQVQTFWFGSEGMLARHDYTADILGQVFRGAHYSADFKDVQGVKLAQTRRVVPRVGIVPLLPFTALSAALSFD